MPAQPAPQDKHLVVTIRARYLLEAGKNDCTCIEDYIEYLKTQVNSLQTLIESYKIELAKHTPKPQLPNKEI